MTAVPDLGDFVEVRGRRWLVEGEPNAGRPDAVRLACVDDDAQGDILEVAWPEELDARAVDEDAWATLAASGTDDPEIFGAYLRTIQWNTATAADRDLFQAPFRAGIQLNAYQLLPLRKALRLPRVNLLVKSLPNPTPISRPIATPFGARGVAFDRVVLVRTELWVSGLPERPSRVWRRQATYPQRW